jgi:cardiolipin synthase
MWKTDWDCYSPRVRFIGRRRLFIMSVCLCVVVAGASPESFGAFSSPNLLQRATAATESVCGRLLTGGNRVTLLINGPATYKAMFEAVRNAKDHVNLEIFSVEDNERGRRLADLLIRKQSEGVQVNLMYDSAGSFFAPASFFDRMRKAGISVLEFDPVNPLKARGAWRPAHRDHRKVLIADGKVVITGGINLAQDYSMGLFPGEEEHKRAQMPWRDTDVRIEGPAVAEFQKNFIDTWKRQKGPELPRRDYFPPLKKEGEEEVCVLANYPGKMNEVIYAMYLSAIDAATESIHLTNAFFIPDKKLQDALSGAAARGVDVKIILPAFGDNPFVFRAGRYYYSKLLKSGVKIYEYRNGVLHAKTAVIDGVWSTVGSANIDYWGFRYDDEENAAIIGRRFAVEMGKMFAVDLRESNEIRQAVWEKRPLSVKIREWLAHLFARWL